MVNLPGAKEKYGDILQETFRELREYTRDNVISVSKVTEEHPLRELLLPRDSTTRLCFFSLPLELLPLYRDRVFPVVEEMGFVPVTADDVVAPGDNINAKLDALIDRASVMIIELTSQWTRAEYYMAVARLKGTEADMLRRRRLKVIVIVTENQELPAAGDFIVIRRPNLIAEDPDNFVGALAGQLREIASEIGVGQQEEPRRLYEAKEYRAAVISSMTLLESTLQQRLGKDLWTGVAVRRLASLGRLVDQAVEKQLIKPESKELVQYWIRLRNEAVHTSKPIAKNEARSVVEGVFDVLTSMRNN